MYTIAETETALVEAVTELEENMAKLEELVHKARLFNLPKLAAEMEAELANLRPWAALARRLVTPASPASPAAVWIVP